MQNGCIMGRSLDEGDIAFAASQLKVTEAHVLAVIAVEAAGSGFLGRYEDDPRLPKILFEAHIFSRETSGIYDISYPQISSNRWNRELYTGGIQEHDRLRQAAKLDFKAAYRSASWGLFQVMGFNHEKAGFSRVEDFVGVQYVSEGMQLQCGISFIIASGLDKHLRAEDWRKFAKGYNGKEYEKNNYHEKLATAFERYSSETAGRSGSTAIKRDKGVKALQQALNRAGFNLTEDGVMGSRTEAAILEFQKREGLAVDGVVGPQTRKALKLK